MLDHPKYWQEFHHSEFNSSIGAVAAAALDNVMRLQISYCRFGSDFSFKLLSNFVSVKQLVLTHNYFYKGEMAALVYSVESQLELLDLSSNNLVKLPSKAFKEFPNLQTINMSNNNITALEEDLFVHNTKLKNIYLRGKVLFVY